MPFLKFELLLFICLHAASIVPYLATEIRPHLPGDRRTIQTLFYVKWDIDVIIMETVWLTSTKSQLCRLDKCTFRRVLLRTSVNAVFPLILYYIIPYYTILYYITILLYYSTLYDIQNCCIITNIVTKITTHDNKTWYLCTCTQLVISRPTA